MRELVVVYGSVHVLLHLLEVWGRVPERRVTLSSLLIFITLHIKDKAVYTKIVILYSRLKTKVTRSQGRS